MDCYSFFRKNSVYCPNGPLICFFIFSMPGQFFQIADYFVNKT